MYSNELIKEINNQIPQLPQFQNINKSKQDPINAQAYKNEAFNIAVSIAAGNEPRRNNSSSETLKQLRKLQL